MRRRAWPFLVLAAVGISAAPAHGGRPPGAELRVAEKAARVGAWSLNWSSHEGAGVCQDAIRDGIPTYRRRLGIDHDHAQPRFVILRDRRPDVLRFQAYARRGFRDTRPVRYSLRPKRRDGDVIGWALRFRVNVARRPFFELDLSYPRRGVCDRGGNASYAFGIGRE